jgi:hypothetical protein
LGVLTRFIYRDKKLSAVSNAFFVRRFIRENQLVQPVGLQSSPHFSPAMRHADDGRLSDRRWILCRGAATMSPSLMVWEWLLADALHLKTGGGVIKVRIPARKYQVGNERNVPGPVSL